MAKKRRPKGDSIPIDKWAPLKKPKRRVIVPTWLCRDDGGTYQMIFSHRAPTKHKYGGWWEDSVKRRNCGYSISADDYEASTLKKYHLKPGGGPLRVKLVGA